MAEFRSLADLANMTQDDLLRGIYQAVVYTDQFTTFADKYSTDRPIIKINREVSLGTAAVVGCDDSISSTSADTSAASYTLDTIVHQFNSCSIGTDLYNSFENQLGVDIAMGAKAMGHTIANYIWNGNGTNFLGLATQVVNKFAIASSALDLGDLDKLIDEVKVNSGKMCFVGRPAVVRAVTRELREAAGGNTFANIQGTDISAPQYLGIPVLKSDWVPAEQLYLVNASFADEGYGLVLGTMPGAQMIGDMFGMKFVQTKADKLQDIYRIWCHATGVLKSLKAAACLTGVV